MEFNASNVRAMMPINRCESERDRMLNYIKRKIKACALTNNNRVEVAVSGLSRRDLELIVTYLEVRGFKVVVEGGWLEVKW